MGAGLKKPMYRGLYDMQEDAEYRRPVMVSHILDRAPMENLISLTTPTDLMLRMFDNIRAAWKVYKMYRDTDAGRQLNAMEQRNLMKFWRGQVRDAIAGYRTLQNGRIVN
jgi:hypothetical protein